MKSIYRITIQRVATVMDKPGLCGCAECARRPSSGTGGEKEDIRERQEREKRDFQPQKLIGIGIATGVRRPTAGET